ncbi:uncharacterized protein LOC143822097 isoform X2 [Paroedura picta]|uniref:uncharacterized protein LOC143822097 isoform X2 n=1 Tax=Paroedura picta TaxID=143630 RepID=UPI0040560959
MEVDLWHMRAWSKPCLFRKYQGSLEGATSLSASPICPLCLVLVVHLQWENINHPTRNLQQKEQQAGEARRMARFHFPGAEKRSETVQWDWEKEANWGPSHAAKNQEDQRE